MPRLWWRRSASRQITLPVPVGIGRRPSHNGEDEMKKKTIKPRELPAAGAAALATPAVAQPAKTATLRFVPQANLTLLDPILTTALVTLNHAYYVFDTLYSAAADGVP